MQQKLVTIDLDSEGYRILGKRSPQQSHGVVQEHLEDYIANGWVIKSVQVGGGGLPGGPPGGNTSGCAWIVALLEK